MTMDVLESFPCFSMNAKQLLDICVISIQIMATDATKGVNLVYMD